MTTAGSKRASSKRASSKRAGSERAKPKLPVKPKPRAKRAGAAAPSIAIKRVYEDVSSGDGMRILVDRLWPRGVSKASLKYDLWPRDLTPSNELRKWYGHDPKLAAEFRRRYLGELDVHRDDLESLRGAIKGRKVTLLTATREIALSHAVVLRDLLLGSRKKT
jgi:uncharacterized protein YeaO (DUF488 family)